MILKNIQRKKYFIHGEYIRKNDERATQENLAPVPIMAQQRNRLSDKKERIKIYCMKTVQYVLFFMCTMHHQHR